MWQAFVPIVWQGSTLPCRSSNRPSSRCSKQTAHCPSVTGSVRCAAARLLYAFHGHAAGGGSRGRLPEHSAHCCVKRRTRRFAAKGFSSGWSVHGHRTNTHSVAIQIPAFDSCPAEWRSLPPAPPQGLLGTAVNRYSSSFTTGRKKYSGGICTLKWISSMYVCWAISPSW